MDENIRRLVFSRPIPERLIASLAIAPLLRPDNIEMWVRCGGVISNPKPHLRAPNPEASVTPPTTKLGHREREAIHLLAKGKTHKQAAHLMGISEGAFSKLTQSARFRLDQSKTAEQAMLVAAARGIVLLPENGNTWERVTMTAARYETLKYVARGFSNQQIADARGVSILTVRGQVKELYEYFHLTGPKGSSLRCMLVSLCFRERIV